VQPGASSRQCDQPHRTDRDDERSHGVTDGMRVPVEGKKNEDAAIHQQREANCNHDLPEPDPPHSSAAAIRGPVRNRVEPAMSSVIPRPQGPMIFTPNGPDWRPLAQDDATEAGIRRPSAGGSRPLAAAPASVSRCVWRPPRSRRSPGRLGAAAQPMSAGYESAGEAVLACRPASAILFRGAYVFTFYPAAPVLSFCNPRVKYKDRCAVSASSVP